MGFNHLRYPTLYLCLSNAFFNQQQNLPSPYHYWFTSTDREPHRNSPTVPYQDFVTLSSAAPSVYDAQEDFEMATNPSLRMGHPTRLLGVHHARWSKSSNNDSNITPNDYARGCPEGKYACYTSWGCRSHNWFGFVLLIALFPELVPWDVSPLGDFRNVFNNPSHTANEKDGTNT